MHKEAKPEAGRPIPAEKKGGNHMYLYQINMRDRQTGEKIYLKVPGINTDDATRKVTGIELFGSNGPYIWEGSGFL
jgi:hypothetical protein